MMLLIHLIALLPFFKPRGSNERFQLIPCFDIVFDRPSKHIFRCLNNRWLKIVPRLVYGWMRIWVMHIRLPSFLGPGSIGNDVDVRDWKGKVGSPLCCMFLKRIMTDNDSLFFLHGFSFAITAASWSLSIGVARSKKRGNDEWDVDIIHQIYIFNRTHHFSFFVRGIKSSLSIDIYEYLLLQEQFINRYLWIFTFATWNSMFTIPRSLTARV